MLPVSAFSSNCKLNLIEIGVFNCEMVAIKLVLAEISSLKTVIFLKIITFPMSII
jgi:hypothetical protein